MKKSFSIALLLAVVAFAGLAQAAPDTLQAIQHFVGWSPSMSDLLLLPVGVAAMNPSQARVVDPVLTQVAQGYQNNELVGNLLFPQVTVNQRAGRIITFGKEGFMLANTARAPGENTKRVQFGYAGSPFALVDYSLEGMVPIENLQEGANGPGIDQGSLAINGVESIMALGLEYAQAQLARLDRQKTFLCANNLSGCVKNRQRGCIVACVDAQRIVAHCSSDSTGSVPRPCSRATAPSRPFTN